MDYLTTCLETAGQLGAGILAGPLYTGGGKRHWLSPDEKKREWMLAVDGLRELARRAEHYGVVLSVEPLNRYRTSVANTAGQVLRMTKPQILFKVTLLQVIKRILPPMGNEIITLVKDTSLANTIANKEIIMMAKEYSAKGLIWPLFSTAIFFLVFVGVLTILFNWLEKKLDYFRC